MSRIAVLSLIFSAPHFLAGSGQTVEIPCDKIGALGPKKCWVTRTQCCGTPGQIYGLTFEDPKDANAIVGYFINIDGTGVVVDLVNEANLVGFCNDCCDGTAAITGNPAYVNGFPAFVAAATTKFCISRLDDGSPYDQNKFAMDYIDKATQVQLFAHDGATGISRYTVSAFVAPVGIGGDTVTAGACV